MEMSLSFGERMYEVPSSKIRSGTILSQEEQLNNWNVKTMTFLRTEKSAFATIFHFLFRWIFNILDTYAH